MIRFSKEASEAAWPREAALAFAIASLQRYTDSGEIFTVVYTAVLSSVDWSDAKNFFDDNFIGIDFSEARSGNGQPSLGGITCIGNSTGTDVGVDIVVRADGLADQLVAMSPHPVGFDGDAEPFATLRVWFPIYPEDGTDGEHLIENMLGGPPRPLVRVELSD